nr:MAG TPA: hypothetical protein [Caudoviricetes sp.]
MCRLPDIHSNTVTQQESSRNNSSIPRVGNQLLQSLER